MLCSPSNTFFSCILWESTNLEHWKTNLFFACLLLLWSLAGPLKFLYFSVFC